MNAPRNIITLKPPFAGRPNLIAPAPDPGSPGSHHIPGFTCITRVGRRSGPVCGIKPSAYLAVEAGEEPAGWWFRWVIKPLGCALGYLILVAMFSMIGLWAIGWE
jgi:hypothetical protein